MTQIRCGLPVMKCTEMECNIVVCQSRSRIKDIFTRKCVIPNIGNVHMLYSSSLINPMDLCNAELAFLYKNAYWSCLLEYTMHTDTVCIL